MGVNQTKASFKERLRSRQPLLGTFVKTPHPAIVEVLGLSGLDCVCLDAEHAPFGRAELNVAILAATSAELPALVRIPCAEPDVILNALDLGATGIIAPHVCSAEQASAIVAASRYSPGKRGYAGSTRAAAYGTRSLVQNLARGEAETTVVLQIEDSEAVQRVSEIARTAGVDALFIGPMDLAVSLGAATPSDPAVVNAIENVVRECRKQGLACGIFSSSMRDACYWAQRGINFFLIESDQQWMLRGAMEAVRAMPEFRSLSNTLGVQSGPEAVA